MMSCFSMNETDVAQSWQSSFNYKFIISTHEYNTINNLVQISIGNLFALISMKAKVFYFLRKLIIRSVHEKMDWLIFQWSNTMNGNLISDIIQKK